MVQVFTTEYRGVKFLCLKVSNVNLQGLVHWEDISTSGLSSIFDSSIVLLFIREIQISIGVGKYWQHSSSQKENWHIACLDLGPSGWSESFLLQGVSKKRHIPFSLSFLE